MKKIAKYQFILLALISAGQLFGASLTQTTFKNGDRVGIMPSTFDPLTLFHEEVIENAISSGKLDYLIVMPTDFTPHKLHRSTMAVRQKMLSLTYKNNPKVLVSEPYEFGYPQSRGAVSFLKKKTKANIEVVAVVLYEDMVGSRIKQIISKFLLKPDSWLVLKPKSSLKENFPATLFGKKVDFIDGEHPKSSSIARKFLLGNESFFTSADVPSTDQLPLNPTLREFVRSQKTYLKKASVCPVFLDIVRPYLPRLGRANRR